MDESPYGVRDLAGHVRDWVQSDHEDDPDLRVKSVLEVDEETSREARSLIVSFAPGRRP